MLTIKELVSVTRTLKVLYVEDNEISRNTTLLVLEELFGFITIAVDGKDGLEKFSSDKFDLIICDLSMPKMNGEEMLKKIRAQNIEIPILILSSHNERDRLLKTIKHGIDAYLLKPLQMQQLMFSLSRVVEKIQLKNENIMYGQQQEEKLDERVHEVLALFKEDQRKYFDPQILDMFFNNLDAFLATRDRYKDENNGRG